MEFETVIGLEVHVELLTKSKLFCGCSTKFGVMPNTNVCPICLGFPGTLPSINKEAVNFAIKTGLALNCDITKKNEFDRKNYFYPDLPKAYQISQFYYPICTNGNLQIKNIEGYKNIGIREIHIEEDAGKLIHDEISNFTLIDYNRCGIPLLEIVSNPDFRSPEEVVLYLTKLKEILIYIGVSNCKMEEGSMRVDINLSIKKAGDKKMGTRTEMKNLSSFKSVSKAINYETERQLQILKNGGEIIQETRRWSDKENKNISMRVKENENDYRYFHEPDLLPIYIDDEWIKSISDSMPELPENKRKRYINDFKISEYDANVITSSKETATLFESIIKLCNEPKEVSNLITGELMRLMSESNTALENLNIDVKKIAVLINYLTSGKINRNTYKLVFEKIFKNDIEPIDYIEKNNLLIINNYDELSCVIDKIINENNKCVEDLKNGKNKAFGFIVGKVMKAFNNKANPKIVTELLEKKLGGK